MKIRQNISQRSSADITINYYDGGVSAQQLVVPITPRSIRRFSLMQDDYIQLEFSLGEAVHISIGDYIDDEVFGRFYITEEQMPRFNARTGGYDYTLRFDADYMRWKQYIFMLMAENEDEDVVRTETSWKLTAPLATHAEQLRDNISRLGFSGYTLNLSAEKAAEVRYLQYDGINIIEAMNMIAEAWDTEWWVEGKTIHFGKCEETSNTPYEMTLGDNVESMDIARDQQTYANRIFAYGGTQNVPETYDKELIWQATTNGSNGFKDDNRPLTLDMIASAPSAVITSFFMAATASAVSTLNPKTYRQVTSSASLNGEQHIAGLVQVAMTMESDDWAGLGYEAPTVGATLILHVGETTTTLNTQSTLSPIGAFGGQTWNYQFNVDTFITPTTANVYLEVLWTITFQQGSQHTNDTLTWDNSGTLLTATASAGASTKAVNVALFGSDTTYPATFDGATGLIKFDGARPSGWESGTKYTLSPLTLKVPISYYTSKFSVGMSAVGDRRIHLPGETRFVQVDDLPARSIVELAVIFPDEFPRLDLRIKQGSIGTAQKTDTITHDDGSVTREDWTQYSFAAEYSADGGQTWSDFNFKTEWIMDGEKLQAAFTAPSSAQTSGFQLAGMTFDVGYDYGRFTIIRNDEYGGKIPNQYIIPHELDTFFLIGWNPMAMAEMGLIGASENRLRTLAIDYLNAIKAGQFNITNRMMSRTMCYYPFCTGTGKDEQGRRMYGLLQEGCKVKVYHAALPNGSKTSRIIGYEYKLDIPFDTPTYIVGETEAYSRLKQIEKKLTKL